METITDPIKETKTEVKKSNLFLNISKIVNNDVVVEKTPEKVVFKD